MGFWPHDSFMEPAPIAPDPIKLDLALGRSAYEQREAGTRGPGTLPFASANQAATPWQCLYFAPEPQGHGALRDRPISA
jgi:hypothetical protein